MKRIVYSSSFYCKICEKNIPLVVYGDFDSDFPHSKEEGEEAVDFGEHYHWIDYHRRCAICGELVVSGNQDNPNGLNLLVNDGSIQIHPEYLRQTLDKTHREELLTVHNKCLEKNV